MRPLRGLPSLPAVAAVTLAALPAGCGQQGAAARPPDGAAPPAPLEAPDAGRSRPPEPRIPPLVGEPEPLDAPFSFLVGGHLYGFIPKRTELPAATFVAAVDRLASGPDAFFVSVGDFVYGPPHLEPTLAFLERLQMPFYNAPGNHDLGDRRDYEQLVHPTYGCFRRGPALRVVLDTQLDPWVVGGTQLAFLRRALDWAAGEPTVEQVLVFAHKLVFACDRPRYAAVLARANARDGLEPGRCNFARDVLPRLAEVAASKPVLWFGGDVGIPGSLPLLLDRDPESGVTFVAVGLGELPRDSLVRVHVAAGEPPRLERVPLVPGKDAAPIEAFGLARWQEDDGDSPR